MTKYDRIKGALYGYAFGDALGVGTEFMTRPEVNAYYPDGLYHFNQIIRDAHRCQWEQGEWTNDTRIFLSILKPVLDEGAYNLNNIAIHLKGWFDSIDDDIPSLYRAVVAAPGWTEDPVGVAQKVWRELGLTEPTNDALHRGLITGLLSSLDYIDERTRELVLMTNHDARCVASAMMIARMANSLLHTGEPASFDELTKLCCTVDARTIPFLDMAIYGTLEDIQLDDENTMTWTRKGMAAALWPIWHCDNASDMIHCVIHAGGDADTNAALAGAFAGLRYGYDALPMEKEKMVGKEQLDLMTDRIVEYLKIHDRY